MRLSRKTDRVLVVAVILMFIFALASVFKLNSGPTYAEGEDATYVESTSHFVTFYDEDIGLKYSSIQLD